MRIDYTRRALGDLHDIAAYLKARSPSGARNVRAAIERTIALLRLFPRLGRPQTTPGVFKIATRGYPYVVYYSLGIDGESIIVLTIRHGARRREFIDA